MILFNIILFTFLISLCVWVAVLFLFLRQELMNRIVVILISLSAGALMGGAFLHLIPEAGEQLKSDALYLVFLSAFAGFFLIEKLLHWRHCHQPGCPIHTFGYMNLVGDAVHNLIDGAVIASTFMLDFNLGLATTMAVAIHEIPQEIGDYGVLISAGYDRKKALLINYAVALTVVVGGVIGYLSFSKLDDFLPYLLPVAAGGFVYIAASDLIPEIRKERSLKKSGASFLVFISGIMIMYAVKRLGA